MKKIICPGELLIDFISSETGKLENVDTFIRKAGGAPANVCGALKKFGCEPLLVASVGCDSFGDYLIRTLESNKLKTDYVQRKKEHHTTLAFVSLDAYGERSFEFNRGADAKLNTKLNEDLKEAICIHFSSATAFLGDELEKTYDEFLQYALDNNILVSFDMNYREALFSETDKIYIDKVKKYIGNSNIVKLSLEEASILTKTNDIYEAGISIKKLGCELLIITNGSQGSMLFFEENVDQVKLNPVPMIDATGAGDAFIGAFLATYLNSERKYKDALESLKIASVSGLITTQKKGALDSIPTLQDVEMYISKHLI